MKKDNMDYKTYKLEGDAFEAAREYGEISDVFMGEVQAIQEEALIKHNAAEKRASLKARECWSRILFSFPFDPEKTYGDPSLMVDTSYVVEHGIAFLVHREMLDEEGNPIKTDKMEMPSIKRLN